MKLWYRINGFFFEPISSTGFGMMRAGWALVVFLFLSFQWHDIMFFYSDAGLLSPEVRDTIVRSGYHFTLLSYITHPLAVQGLCMVLLASLLLMMVGILPRLMTFISVVLLFSFHEANPHVLTGGDTILRAMGFLLVLAPGTSAFSLDRLQQRIDRFVKTKTIDPPLLQPIWPYRLLLWQVIVLYGTSLWYKLLGASWIHATAVVYALHHPLLTRFPATFNDHFLWLMPFVAYATLLWEGLWVLLLIPGIWNRRFKRWLIFVGILFHGSIFLLIDAGSFSLAMFVAYLGLLVDCDLMALKRLFGHRPRIVVLYDGHCGLCLRSTAFLKICDWLGRLQLVDFRDEHARKSVAPDISTKELNKALHIRFINGKTKQGYAAFKSLCAVLPPLWPMRLVLWIPGTTIVGRMIYKHIADTRKRCAHKNCKL